MRWIGTPARKSGGWICGPKTFPGAHALNGTFASPILADGKIVVAGGALEQGIRYFLPKYEGFTGRGFVMALEPQSGRIAWKYDVGPKPERLDPPITIKDAWGEHVFHFGPATSTVWSTPSYHAASRTIFFGTDTNNAPRRPTKDDPRLDTRHACAVIAIDARDGSEKWVTQINRGDVWNASMRAYDPKTGRYLDLSIGDTPEDFHDHVEREADPRGRVWLQERRVLHRAGFGRHDPGPHAALHRPADGPAQPPARQAHAGPARPHRRPADRLCHGWQARVHQRHRRHRAGDSRIECTTAVRRRAGASWRSAWIRKRSTGVTSGPKWRPVGGPPPKPVFKNVGDPVASGIAVANGVVYFTTLMSSKLVALDAATGKKLREIQLPPVWSGPAVSRGRVYVGTGNIVLPDPGFDRSDAVHGHALLLRPAG